MYQTSRKSYYLQSETKDYKFYYSRPISLMDERITKINKMIADGEPVAKIVKAIQDFLDSPGVILSAANDPNIRAMLQFVAEHNKIVEYSNQINTLETYIIDLKKTWCPCGPGNNGFRMQPFQTGQNSKIRKEYIYYIQQYGLPEDGIFNPALLIVIKLKYNIN